MRLSTTGKRKDALAVIAKEAGALVGCTMIATLVAVVAAVAYSHSRGYISPWGGGQLFVKQSNSHQINTTTRPGVAPSAGRAELELELQQLSAAELAARMQGLAMPLISRAVLNHVDQKAAMIWLIMALSSPKLTFASGHKGGSSNGHADSRSPPPSSSAKPTARSKSKKKKAEIPAGVSKPT